MANLIDRDALLIKQKAHADLFADSAARDDTVRRDEATAALAEIINAPAVNRWIPCSERLPEAGMPVLIYACKHRVTAYYDNCKNLFRLTENDNLYYIAEYVTHWMPLPEPPKTEEGGKQEWTPDATS